MSRPYASSADGPARGRRFTVVSVASTGSTNADLLERAAADPHAVDIVLVADHQHAGRGRLDRRWDAPAGQNLLMSVLFRPGGERPLAPEQWHRYAWAVGLAASRACQAMGVDARMKWPNDLVARDAKLAGLLAESRVRAPDLSAPDTSAVVVGLGLNVGWPAADEMPGATSLASCGVTTTVDAVLHALLERIDEHSPTLADDVRAQSATLGRRVRVEQVSRSRDSGPAPVLEGRAVELGDDGRLLVVDDQGRHHWVAVGDVLHLRARDGLDRLE